VKRKLAEPIVVGLLIGILVLVIGVIVYLIITSRKDKDIVDVYTEQLAVNTNKVISETQKLFDYIKFKPGAKGGIGEGIVELLLSHLPKNYVKTQYSPADISGIIDFVVKLPESDFWLPIDSKFISPEYLDPEKIVLEKNIITKLNKEVISRAKGITKYINSKETTDFVLMYVPDFIYGIINNDAYNELAEIKVVPTNTSGLLSTIFMINMQHRFIQLNKAASEFGEIQIKLKQGIKTALEKIRTGQSQLTFCINNFSSTSQTLEELKNLVETLEIEGS